MTLVVVTLGIMTLMVVTLVVVTLGGDTGGGDTGGDSCGGDWVTWWRRERPGATDQGARGQEWDEACTQSSHPRDAL